MFNTFSIFVNKFNWEILQGDQRTLKGSEVEQLNFLIQQIGKDHLLKAGSPDQELKELLSEISSRAVLTPKDSEALAKLMNKTSEALRNKLYLLFHPSPNVLQLSLGDVMDQLKGLLQEERDEAEVFYGTLLRVKRLIESGRENELSPGELEALIKYEESVQEDERSSVEADKARQALEEFRAPIPGTVKPAKEEKPKPSSYEAQEAHFQAAARAIHWKDKEAERKAKEPKIEAKEEKALPRPITPEEKKLSPQPPPKLDTLKEALEKVRSERKLVEEKKMRESSKLPPKKSKLETLKEALEKARSELKVLEEKTTLEISEEHDMTALRTKIMGLELKIEDAEE